MHSLQVLSKMEGTDPITGEIIAPGQLAWWTRIPNGLKYRAVLTTNRPTDAEVEEIRSLT